MNEVIPPSTNTASLIEGRFSPATREDIIEAIAEIRRDEQRRFLSAAAGPRQVREDEIPAILEALAESDREYANRSLTKKIADWLRYKIIRVTAPIWIAMSDRRMAKGKPQRRIHRLW